MKSQTGTSALEVTRPGTNVALDLEINWSMTPGRAQALNQPAEDAGIEILSGLIIDGDETHPCCDQILNEISKDSDAMAMLMLKAEDDLREDWEAAGDDYAHAAADREMEIDF